MPCLTSPTTSLVCTSFDPCCVHTALLRVKTHAAPACESNRRTRLPGPCCRRRPAPPEALPSGSRGAGADELRPLLGPGAVAAGEHPCGSGQRVVPISAYQGGVAIWPTAPPKYLAGPYRHSQCQSASPPGCIHTPLLRVNTHAAPPAAEVVPVPPNEGGIAIGRQRHRAALPPR